MKYRTVVEREGEFLGPVDWSHEMLAELESTDWGRRTLEMFRKIEAEPEKWLASTDGGSPKIGYHQVWRVGMYDGWPYWKPTPSFQTAGTLGPEWHSARCLTDITEAK